MREPTPDPLVRWLATIASTLIAAAIIGMASVVWTMSHKVAVLETRVDALQNQHDENDPAAAK